MAMRPPNSSPPSTLGLPAGPNTSTTGATSSAACTVGEWVTVHPTTCCAGHGTVAPHAARRANRPARLPVPACAAAGLLRCAALLPASEGDPQATAATCPWCLAPHPPQTSARRARAAAPVLPAASARTRPAGRPPITGRTAWPAPPARPPRPSALRRAATARTTVSAPRGGRLASTRARAHRPRNPRHPRPQHAVVLRAQAP